MKLLNKVINDAKTIWYPPPKRKGNRLGINKFGILLSDYDSYDEYKKALHKVSRKIWDSLPKNKAKRKLRESGPEFKAKRNIYTRQWRKDNPEAMARASIRDKAYKRERYRKMKIINSYLENREMIDSYLNRKEG